MEYYLMIVYEDKVILYEDTKTINFHKPMNYFFT